METIETPGHICSETGAAEYMARGSPVVTRTSARFCPARQKYCFTTCEFCKNLCPCPFPGEENGR